VLRLDSNLTPPDYKTGFGGKFGVQTDRVDKTAVGWEHNEKVRRVTTLPGISRKL
jgi:cortactin